jgi:hypothetical protein
MSKTKLMIAHGKTNHKFGEDCKVCEEVHADNPYVKKLIQDTEKRVLKDVLSDVDLIFAYELDKYGQEKFSPKELKKKMKEDRKKEGE